MAAEADSKNRAEIAAGRWKRDNGALQRWFGCLSALRRDQDGVSSVELALFAALILPPLASVFDFGMAFSEQIKLQQAVQAGAQYASMNVWNGSTSPTTITNAVKNALPASLSSSVTVYGDGSNSAPYEACYCPSGTGLTSADSLTTCGTTTCSDGESSGYYVTLGATLSYTPIAPYSFVFMSNPQTLTASSVVRVQ